MTPTLRRLDHVRPPAVRTGAAVLTSFGFGGHNA